MSLFKREPVAVFSALQIVLVAVLGLLAVFDIFTPNEAQGAAIVAVYVAVSGFVTLFVRGSVTPIDKA